MTSTSEEETVTLKSSELFMPATATIAPVASSMTGMTDFCTKVIFASEKMSLSFFHPFMPKGRILSDARHCLILSGKRTLPASAYRFPSLKSKTPVQPSPETAGTIRKDSLKEKNGSTTMPLPRKTASSISVCP